MKLKCKTVSDQKIHMSAKNSTEKQCNLGSHTLGDTELLCIDVFKNIPIYCMIPQPS